MFARTLDWPHPGHTKIGKRFAHCSQPWRIRTRETSCFEPCYSRPGRVKTRERFATLISTLVYKGKGDI